MQVSPRHPCIQFVYYCDRIATPRDASVSKHARSVNMGSKEWVPVVLPSAYLLSAIVRWNFTHVMIFVLCRRGI